MNQPRSVSGARIKAARLAAGFSQFELARRAGVSERNIVRWENNRHTPRLEHLIAIARATGVSVDELFDTSDDDEESSSMPNHRDILEALHDAIGQTLGKSVRA